MFSSLIRRLGSIASTIAEEDDWHGTAEVVIAAPVERVWEIASNWLEFPRGSVECSEGENGVPGCVRRIQPYDSTYWVAEKLTRIDHVNRIITYDVVGGNSGIEIGYQAAIQTIGEGTSRTRVLWPFRFSSDQPSVESFTRIVKAKLTAHIKELEKLARES